jgi:superoxide dismutase, Cu-Zn family
MQDRFICFFSSGQWADSERSVAFGTNHASQFRPREAFERLRGGRDMRYVTKKLISLIAVAASASAIGCTGRHTTEAPSPEHDETAIAPSSVQPAVTEAIAVLHPTATNNTRGTITFTQGDDDVHVRGTIEGLSSGTHGFHVHQLGDCSAPDGTSAGGHFAPRGEPHGAPSDEHRHVGDLGNVVADESGRAQVDHHDEHLALSGSRSIIGRAVIVHAGADDLETQPTGAAGPRVACGVIGVSNGES